MGLNVFFEVHVFEFYVYFWLKRLFLHGKLFANAGEFYLYGRGDEARFVGLLVCAKITEVIEIDAEVLLEFVFQNLDVFVAEVDLPCLLTDADRAEAAHGGLKSKEFSLGSRKRATPKRERQFQPSRPLLMRRMNCFSEAGVSK